MTDSTDGGPCWAARLAAVCLELRDTGEDPDRSAGDRARNAHWEEAWVLLNAGLGRYLRLHAVRLGPVPAEDLEDLAAAKSLDLVGRAVSGAWDTKDRSAGEVAAFLSTVAPERADRLEAAHGSFRSIAGWTSRGRGPRR